MSIGRPTRYTDDMPDRVLGVFRQGLGVASVCAELGVCLQTFHTWMKEHPALLEAYNYGKALQASRLENIAIRAISESDNRIPQNLTKFFLERQAKGFGYEAEQAEQTVTQINIGKDAMDDADLNNVLNSIRRKK